ncbi:MAG: hypothetical protein HDP28_01215 [Clostridia bacterium]|nr:hypothetical protein [Clostridia bacterium]
MKKILILTVTAGNGHNACARGMKNKLEALSGDVEVKIVDLLKCYSTKRNFWITDRGYSIAVSKLPKLYNAFYYHYCKAKPYKRYSCPSQSTVLSTLDGLYQEIFSFQPDVIYCTHFYGAIALTDLKLVYELPCKTIVTNLDYVNSPFWEAGIGVDYFAIPNEDFTEEFLAEGYRREQLLPIGIPVNERTLEKVDKAEARKALGLDENLFTVMVMFGGGQWSGGFKIFKRLIKSLKGRKAQVIMINGRDKKSFKKVQKMKFESGIKVCNVGFTDNVPLYLSAADIILNKFGGTSVAEMLNKSLPMLITEELPAQEECNLNYMKKKGVALSFKNGKELKAHILRLMDNPEILEQMSKSTLPFRKSATTDLAEFILSQPNADYSGFSGQTYSNDLRVRKNVKRAVKAADKKEKKEAKSRK